MKTALVTTVCSAFAMLASAANALEPKQCLPMAEMTAALAKEGQKSLVFGNRTAVRDGKGGPETAYLEKWVNTFTANGVGPGSVGYNIEGDKPLGTPSTKACVAAKYINVTLYDARKPGTPSAAKRGGDFDSMLADNETRSVRPMLQADTVSTAANGEIRRGGGLLLLGQTQRKAGYLEASSGGGSWTNVMFMQETDYTPTALAILDGQSR